MNSRIVIVVAALIAAGAVAATSLLKRQPPQLALATRPVTAMQLSAPGDLQPLWDVPTFALTDQDGKSVSGQDLRGRVWVADFVFAGCAGSCRQLSLQMSRLQHELSNSKVQFISFDVDPDHDVATRLKEFATAYQADPLRWHFLGFPSRVSAFEFVRGMRATAKQDDRDFQILHSDYFLLIDADGRVRGVYDATQEAGLRQVAADAMRLASEG